MRKKDRETETLNLSFLDVICCGFGAIILLLVLTKIFEPIRLEESQVELEELIARYEEELNDLRGETEIIEREQISTVTQLDADNLWLSRLLEQLSRIRSEFLATGDNAEVDAELEGNLHWRSSG